MDFDFTGFDSERHPSSLESRSSQADQSDSRFWVGVDHWRIGTTVDSFKYWNFSSFIIEQ